jgi:hypothetical protein
MFVVLKLRPYIGQHFCKYNRRAFFSPVAGSNVPANLPATCLGKASLTIPLDGRQVYLLSQVYFGQGLRHNSAPQTFPHGPHLVQNMIASRRYRKQAFPAPAPLGGGFSHMRVYQTFIL